jgi:putative hemolysin
MSHWLPAGLCALAFAALVVVSGFYAGIGAALIAVSRARLRHGNHVEDDRRVQRVLELFGDAQQILAVSSIGSTIASVAALIALLLGLIALGGDAAQPITGRILAAALCIAVPALLVFGEIRPRRLFRERADRMIAWLYHPIRWSVLVLGPIARAGLWLAGRVSASLGANGGASPVLIPRGEPWQSLLETRQNPESDIIDEATTERRMIHGIFDLQRTRVREIMRPLVDVVAVRLPETAGGFRALAREHGYSRYPVYRDRITNLTGYLDVYTVLSENPPDEASVEPFVREALYVPDTKRLDDLFQEMLQGHHKVVIIVDEYGGCSGWATREDLLEEIVGEIEDEFDEDEETIRPIDPHTYLAAAAIHVDDLHEVIDLHLRSEEFDTLGGFIYDRLGRIPREGDTVEEEGAKIEVVKMENRRIVTVKITLPSPEEPAPESD